MKKTAILFCVLQFVSNLSYAQFVQIGFDIDGEVAGDFSGSVVSMPDKYTIAIGAKGNNGTGIKQGHVRIYRWNGITWVQKGSNINGEADNDQSGTSVSMPDSNTIAIGANRNGAEAGHVRIYRWNGSAWVQKGNDIDGEAAGDHSGLSVCMPDSNTVAIGAPFNDDNIYGAGHVRIYHWNGSAWVQKGSDIEREHVGDQFGRSVSMPDSNTIAIGAPYNGDNGINSGHVRIYHWNGIAWIQKGDDIDGEAAGDNSGWSISMPDSNTIAIGAHFNNGNGIDAAGHVRIYQWNGNTWTQKGIDLDGEAAFDNSGWSVSMRDNNTIAIGALYNNGHDIHAGHVRIYRWNGSTWIQKENDIDGKVANERSGFSVSMPDSNTVAIGVPGNNTNGTDAGQSRVYTNKLVAKIEFLNSDFRNSISVYPSPADGEINLNFGSIIEDITLVIKNALGQNILTQSYNHVNIIRINLPGEAGLYFVEVKSNNKNATFKVLKK